MKNRSLEIDRKSVFLDRVPMNCTIFRYFPDKGSDMTLVSFLELWLK